VDRIEDVGYRWVGASSYIEALTHIHDANLDIQGAETVSKILYGEPPKEIPTHVVRATKAASLEIHIDKTIG
jgi:hypothetical protein